MINLFRKKERILIKTKVPYLQELIGNGIEYTYKSGCVGSGEGWKYWRNFGQWSKKIRRYEIIILGENYYNYDVSRFIKQFNPRCKVIVFFWNKLVNKDWLEIFNDKNVDEFYTFDEEEAKKYNISFNSTFYTKRKKLPINKINKDVVFLGRSKDREKELLNLKNKLEKANLKLDFNIIKDEKDYIEYNDYLKKVSKAKAILDYNAYNQAGLSLRTMEALFFKKKLITSNKNIKNYDFYNKNNIFIIGKDDWKNINTFINSRYEKIDQNIIDYYDFDEWIKRFK